MSNKLLMGEKQERKQFKPGWYPDLSNEEYHGSAGYSSSLLKYLNEKTMAHLLYKQRQPQVPTEAMIKGTALHTLILEPEKFDQEFMIKPDDLKRPSISQLNAKSPSAASKKQIAKWEEHLEELGDRTEITQSSCDHAKAMAKRVREHPAMAPLLSLDAAVEQSVYYWYNPEDWDEVNDYRIMCKIRPDLILKGHNVIFDLKSTRDAAYTPFMRQARKLGYHLSAAMYLHGANSCPEFLEFAKVNAFTKFVWIVVENEPPYEVALYEIKPEDREKGNLEYHKAARRAYQYKNSEWKGYGEVIDGEFKPVIRKSEIPDWGSIIV